ncbi:MAG TPA: pitrilysin family protein [Acidisarcina sp.]|nr:pitrilysin family protein [Acidisarcina sp.]
MNRNATLALAAALSLLAVPALRAQSAQPQAQPWKSIAIPPLHAFHPQQPKRIALPNGVVVFLQEDHELPFVNGFVELRGGSRDIDPAKAGLIDLYGETWRTSGTATINGDKLDDLLEAKAAKVETNGDLDSTSVGWSCLKADQDQVFAIAVDLLLHPVFNQQKLELAKQAAAAEIVRRNEDPGGIAAREAAKLVYGAQSPYSRISEIATVQSVTVDDLKKWHDHTVVPNNMIVGVSGDFDSAQMERRIREAFEPLKPGTKILPPNEKFSGPTPGVYLVDKQDVNQSNIWIVGLGTERRNPDYFALALMNEIFSGGFGSRLFQKVRTQLGLAYSVGGSYGASYDHPGLFHVVAGTKSASTVDATQAMLKEIDNLKTQPFTEEELKNAKDQILNSFIFSYDSKEKILSESARLEFYGYPADFLEKYRAGIEKVTTADVQRVARKYIDPSKLAILVVGNAADFGTPLEKLGKVQPVDITIPMPPGMEAPGGKGR